MTAKWSGTGATPDLARGLCAGSGTTRARVQRAAAPAGPEAERKKAQAAQARRAQRADRVASGLSELEEWLRDQVRVGLPASIGPSPGGHADVMAARMVDAQSSSITTQGTARALQGLLASAARRVPVTGPRDHAAELIRLTHRPDCAYRWLGLLRRAADTITLRRAFAEALSSAA